MALSKLAANSFDLTDNYALTGTVTGVTSTQKIFLIKNLDASSSATRTFIDGSNGVDLDNTYKTYLFKFINIHGSATAQLTFQGSTQGASSSDGDYANNMTTTYFVSRHDENGSNGTLQYDTGNDQAQGSSFQLLADNFGADNDASLCGELWLFNPSSTTFVKHFMSTTQYYQSAVPRTNNTFIAGYFNTTSAINAIRFKMSSGNIDSGRIALYGIK